MWANLAAAHSTGDTYRRAAELREDMASKMTREQIAKAQRLAREWKPQLK
jgi:hypothetical protein